MLTLQLLDSLPKGKNDKTRRKSLTMIRSPGAAKWVK